MNIKGKLLSTITAVMLCMLAFATANVFAATEGIYTYTVADGKATITSCSSTASGSITIPDTLGGKPVTAIANEAFKDRIGITQVTIGENILTIGTKAFYNCTGLESVTIPDSITTINSYTFYGCNKLTSLVIPDSVTSIESYAFNGCSSLTKVVIPDSVTSIGSSAFYNCTSITDLVIGKNVTTIGSYAFNGCSNLTKVVIPDSVTSIGTYAFCNCSSMTDLVIGKGVTTIGTYAFNNCSKLETLTIPDNVTQIGSSAFSYCSALKELTIGKNVTSIGSSAFQYTSALEKINWNAVNIPDFGSSNHVFYNSGKSGDGITLVFGDEVERIPAYAFYPHNDTGVCPKITSIKIGDKVGSIGQYAFYNCSYLTHIEIGKNVTTIGSYAFSGCNNLTSLVIPDNVTSIDTYAFYNGSSMTDLVIGKNVTTIGSHAFSGCSSLTKVVIPDNVTSIGSYAFYNCTSMTDLVIGKGVTTIGTNSFTNCSKLETLTIPDNVTQIGSSAFSSCSALKELTIGKNVTSIGSSAFQYASKLERLNWNAVNASDISSVNYIFYNAGKSVTGVDVIFGDEVERIPSHLFYATSESSYLPKIKSVHFGKKVSSVGTYAFYNITGIQQVTADDISVWLKIDFADSYANPIASNECLYINNELVKKLVIPDDVTTIGTYSFYDYSILNDIAFGENLTSIERSAFYRCTGLTDITLPEKLNNIGAYAFSGCNQLTRITIPDSVTTIGNYAFSGCSRMVSAVVGDGAVSIGDNAFASCSSLVNVTIGKNVESIGTDAFNNCSNLIRVDITDMGNWCTITFNGEYSNPLRYAKNIYLNGVLVEDLVVPYGVEFIGNYAFEYATCLKTVTIPDSVKTIEYNAFYYCNNITDVKLSENLKTIESNAFCHCSALKAIKIPDSTTTLGSSAFYKCSSMTDLTIGVNMEKINDYAFYECTALEKINWYATRVYDFSSDNYVFDSAGSKSNGIDVIFHDTVEYIPVYVFTVKSNSYSYCPKISSIVIGKGISAIASSTFYYSRVKTLTLSNTVTAVGNSAFYGCSSLATVYYDSNENAFNKIAIGSSNSALTKAQKIYVANITFMDCDGNVITTLTQNLGTYLDLSTIIVPEGATLALYTDKECKNIFDTSTPLENSLVLYVKMLDLNHLSITGKTKVDPGEKGVLQVATFSTDKEAKYLVCTLEYSDKMTLSQITSPDFNVYEDYSYQENGYSYLCLICEYKGDGNIPQNVDLTAFEMMFDISGQAMVNEVLSVSILDDAVLTGDDAYPFDAITNAEITINSVLVESITIQGADAISAPSKYTASVLPENATINSVKWSVSDDTIATISEDGILTPLKKGNVILTATAMDLSGVSCQKEIAVNVVATVTGITSNVGTWDKAFDPNVNNYTIIVPDTTASIRLTAIHNGTLKADNTTFFNKVARTIQLNSDTVVLTLTYSCAGYDDNTYTITIKKYKGTSTTLSPDGKVFTVTPEYIESGKAVILAIYDGDRFIEAQSAIYHGEPLTFTTHKAYTNAKVMVWDSVASAKSVCDAEIIK